METTNTSVGSIPAEEMMTVASLALLVYDYFLTLDSESERFWKGRLYRGLNWSSSLFFANRYLALLGYIPITLELFKRADTDPTRCRYILGIYNIILWLVIQIIIACMMLLRVYALYERRVGILALPAIIAICGIMVGIVAIIRSPSSEMPRIPFRCDSGLSADQAYYFAGAYGGEFMFDIAIFAMTLYKTLMVPKGSGFRLLATIMRDGMVYFGVVATVNLANILVLILADPINRGAMTNPSIVIPSIMMTRLMLNLRDPRLSGDAEEFKTTTLNIRGFCRSTGSGTAGGDSRNVFGNERDA